MKYTERREREFVDGRTFQEQIADDIIGLAVLIILYLVFRALGGG